MPNTLLEIKTTKNDQKKLIHSSTDQIAPVYDKSLKLIFIQIKKNINGLSLNDLIDELFKNFKRKQIII